MANNRCPRTIFKIVRCPGNSRTILEFGGQFKKNYEISKFDGQFLNLADNFWIWRTISKFGGQLSVENLDYTYKKILIFFNLIIKFSIFNFYTRTIFLTDNFKIWRIFYEFDGQFQNLADNYFFFYFLADNFGFLADNCPPISQDPDFLYLHKWHAIPKS